MLMSRLRASNRRFVAAVAAATTVVVVAIAVVVALSAHRDAEPPSESEWSVPRTVYFAATSHSVSSAFKAFWEATGEATYLGNPLSEEYVVAGTTYQVFERGQLARTAQSDPWLTPVGTILADCYGLDRSPQPRGDLPIYDESIFVPKPAPSGPVPQPPAGYQRAIVVSLGRQALWAYEGDTVVRSTFVSTGKKRFETPPGLFFINTKVPMQDMEGNILGEYYFEPHVPDVKYFTDEDHAIYGVYWHNNFGAPMSTAASTSPSEPLSGSSSGPRTARRC
jgi:hypothetical protein